VKPYVLLLIQTVHNFLQLTDSQNLPQDTFETAELYYGHANKEHSPELAVENWIACHSCKLLLPTETSRAVHRKSCQTSSATSASVQCHFCSETLASVHEYHAHANSCHGESIVTAGWLLCGVCNGYVPPGVNFVHL
jgi:hypothetical protein